jgi:hypothetical protein
MIGRDSVVGAVVTVAFLPDSSAFEIGPFPALTQQF